MTRSMSIAAIALAILTLAGVQAQAQSEFKGKIGTTPAVSKEYRLSAGQEKELDSHGTVAEHTELVSGNLERDIILAVGAGCFRGPGG